MTDRELRLRARIDRLTDERDAARASTRPARHRDRRPTRCPYCAAPCYGRACSSHRDLLPVDPYFADAYAAARLEAAYALAPSDEVTLLARSIPSLYAELSS